jgi:hypothetical protein
VVANSGKYVADTHLCPEALPICWIFYSGFCLLRCGLPPGAGQLGHRLNPERILIILLISRDLKGSRDVVFSAPEAYIC